MERRYQWFIEPLDDEANSMLGALLAIMQMADDTVVGLPVNINGKPTRINAYRVPHKIVQYVQESKKHRGLKIKIWNREGEQGKLREWKFPKKKLKK